MIAGLSFCLLMVAIGGLIGQRKGRPVVGIVLAIFLGPIGWIIMALIPKKLPSCPACGTSMKGYLCPSCKYDTRTA